MSAFNISQVQRHKKSRMTSKAIPLAVAMLFAAGGVQPLHAETATATANQTTVTANSTLTERSIEDAVLGNEAIRDTLGNDALPFSNSATQSASTSATTQTAPTRPTTSSQAPVAADKLILNNPVIDEAHVLSANEKYALEQKLRGIYEQGLAQAAVVIVPTTNGEDIFDYSMKVADRWQLGRKDTDNGLLMVVAVNDRDMYILTGYGLEGTIPDAIAKRIITDDITPYFKQGDYAGGISAGVNRIEQRLTTDPTILKQADAKQQTAQDSQGLPPIVLGVLGFILGTMLTSILGRFLGSLFTAGGIAIGGTVLGAGFFASLMVAMVVFFMLLVFGGRGGGRGGRGGGGFIILPGGGGFGGGGFGGGGFGGGGFGGGGGGFGGGGAGGSW